MMEVNKQLWDSYAKFSYFKYRESNHPIKSSTW